MYSDDSWDKNMLMSVGFSGSTVSKSPSFDSISQQQSPVTSTESIRKLFFVSWLEIWVRPFGTPTALRNNIVYRIRENQKNR